MKQQDKTAPAAPARQNRWSPMTWALLGLVLASIAGTIVVGMGLYAVTGEPPRYNTN